MMTDVSDRVRVEEAREQFIGILGHDLRNPLTAVMVGMDLLCGIGEPYGSVVQRISRSARRMEVIIRDVLDFARGRLSGGIPVRIGSCDIAKIGADVVNEIKQGHPSRDIAIEATGDLIGECDAARVEQVLSNLIGNAITHGADPIRVHLVDAGDEIVMMVHTRGATIPSAMIPRLFEPYSHGVRDRDARERAEGLGLGLYIVSEIVRAHGGTVAVASAEADGTTFTIRLPRCPTARARLAAKA